MSLNYTPFLHLVKSKMKHGGRGEEESLELYAARQHGCVCLFSVGSNLAFFFFFAGRFHIRRGAFQSCPSRQRVQQILQEEVWVWDFREET